MPAPTTVADASDTTAFNPVDLILAYAHRPTSIARAMLAIRASSTNVTFVIGRLNTVARQAHWMRRLWSSAWVTPTTLTSITTRVTTLVMTGANWAR